MISHVMSEGPGIPKWSRISALSICIGLGVLASSSTVVPYCTSVTFDELDHFSYAQRLLDGQSERTLKKDDSKTPVTTLNVLATRLAGVESALNVQNQSFTNPIWEPPEGFSRALWIARLPTVLWLALLCSLVWVWAARLYGPWGGMLSLVLTALSPSLLAHGRLITTDVPFATVTIAVLFAAWRYVERPSSRRAAVLGALLGVAQLVKFTGVLLFPLLPLIVAVGFYRRSSPRTRSMNPRAWLKHAGLVTALPLLVINLGYGFDDTLFPLSSVELRSRVARRAQSLLGDVPIPLPKAYVTGLDWVKFRSDTGHFIMNTYLLGELRQSRLRFVPEPTGDRAEASYQADNRGFRPFRTYFLVAWLFKEPLPSLLLLLGTLATLGRRHVGTGRGLPAARSAEAMLLVTLVSGLVFFSLFFRPQMGIRFILFLLPVGYLLCGRLLRGVAIPTGRSARAIGAACVWLVISVGAGFPDYLAYFNVLIGPRSNAYRFLVDSNLEWGQHACCLRNYLRDHPEVVQVNPRRPNAYSRQITPTETDGHTELSSVRFGRPAIRGPALIEVNRYVGVFSPKEYAWLRRLQPAVTDHACSGFLVIPIDWPSPGTGPDKQPAP